MVAAIVSAVVVAVSSLLTLRSAALAGECVVQSPANGSRDVYCDVIPYEIDLSRVADDIDRLDVSGNRVTGVRLSNSRAAHRNVTLAAVDLSRNRIPCVCRVVTGAAVRVESIVLSYNEIRDFSTCTDARNLTLRWNRIAALRRADMVNASAVQALDVAHNRVLWIENDTFAGMPDLQWLDLGGNAVTRISDRTLPGGRALRYLDVSSGNRDDADPNEIRFYQPFENLAELNVAGNADLAPSLVLLGSGPHLQSLDASRTNLTAVPAPPAPLLGRLVLSGNAITAVNGGDLDGFPLLRLLNISRNRIAAVEDDAFGRLDLLTVLDLSGNLLTAVPRMLPRGLETLDLADNRIPALAVDDFDGCARLTRLTVRGNLIGRIQDYALAPLVYLELLDLSANPIAMITREMLTGPVRLTALKMERLAATETTAFPFTDTRYLKRIHLAHSPQLAAVLLNDTAVLSSVAQLEHLDLTGCAVPGLPDRMPDYAPKMKTLIADRLPCVSPPPAWLLDWLCEVHRAAARVPEDGPGPSELRLRNYRLPEPDVSPASSVRCTRSNDSGVEQVFDRKRCAAIVTTTTTTTTASQAQAVFARLRAKDPEPPGGAIQVAAVKTGHPGMVVFGCVVLMLVVLAAGTVWIGVVRGDALKRLHWKQSGAADVDYQSIEIKSLESLNHVQAVDRW